MGKAKSSKLAAGSPVRVVSGVAMPEFPAVDISGWTGSVCESQGKGDAMKYIIEWDAAALSQMPAEYREHCDLQGLCHEMACLPAATLEPA